MDNAQYDYNSLLGEAVPYHGGWDSQNFESVRHRGNQRNDIFFDSVDQLGSFSETISQAPSSHNSAVPRQEVVRERHRIVQQRSHQRVNDAFQELASIIPSLQLTRRPRQSHIIQAARKYLETLGNERQLLLLENKFLKQEVEYIRHEARLQQEAVHASACCIEVVDMNSGCYLYVSPNWQDTFLCSPALALSGQMRLHDMLAELELNIRSLGPSLPMLSKNVKWEGQLVYERTDGQHILRYVCLSPVNANTSSGPSTQYIVHTYEQTLATMPLIMECSDSLPPVSEQTRDMAYAWCEGLPLELLEG
eukprot:Colp12_sorted_trinity150504_noHs@20413